MFAYCGNNPVSRVDDAGEFWNVVFGTVVGAAVGVITNAVSNVIEGKDWDDGLAQAAVTGAISGFVAAAFPGASCIVDATLNAAESIYDDIKSGEDVGTIATNAVVSVGFGLLSDGSSIYSSSMIDDTFMAFGRITKGNHPRIKDAALDFINDTCRAIENDFVSSITEGVASGMASDAAKWIAGYMI